MTTRLRRATLADFPALGLMRPAPDQAGLVGRFADWPDETRDRAFLHVIEHEGAPVGFFRIDPAFHDRDPRLPPGAHGLRGLLIDAGRQGRGIGRAALTALPGHLRACHDLTEVFLTVDRPNTRAIHLYEATGWTPVGLPDLAGRSGPEMVMRRDLSP